MVNTKRGKRGKSLESDVNKANLRYRKSKKALILQVNLPVKLTKDGPIAMQSTVDFSGTLAPKGQSIDFDCKECGSKTSFPLADIREHQLNYLLFKKELGGVVFFLLNMYNIDPDNSYKIPIEFIKEYWENAKNGGRKSIPVKDLKNEWKVLTYDYLS